MIHPFGEAVNKNFFIDADSFPGYNENAMNFCEEYSVWRKERHCWAVLR